jgi:hypothetical protein
MIVKTVQNVVNTKTVSIIGQKAVKNAVGAIKPERTNTIGQRIARSVPNVV